jgi:hypothetical protein
LCKPASCVCVYSDAHFGRRRPDLKLVVCVYSDAQKTCLKTWGFPSRCFNRLSLSLSLSHTHTHKKKKTWGFPSQFINQPRGYGRTTRATPGVSLPSGSRTRNLRILDAAHKPLRCSGDASELVVCVYSDAQKTSLKHGDSPANFLIAAYKPLRCSGDASCVCVCTAMHISDAEDLP